MSDAITTILFDFDGTLADTVAAGVMTFNELARRYGFYEITAANAEALRAQGPRGAMKTLAVPIYRVPTVLRSLRRGVRSVIPDIAFIDGMRNTVVALRAAGYRLGIVTSNSEENVRAFLANNGVAEAFDFIQAGTGIFNKASKIKKLIRREKLKKDEIVFVGDEIRDVQATRKNGLKVIAVTWGLNSRDGLETAGANVIVRTPEELQNVLGC